MTSLSHSIFVAAVLLASTTGAHMFISSPSPIPGTAPKNPLDASGSDFPCHGAALPSSGGQRMAAGSRQTLAWELGGGANTATHGGGSCQMAITYETEPAKQKDPASWRVIHSFEGGCPTDAAGNLPTAVKCARDGGGCVNEFGFTIPRGVRDGHAIMAATWFNTIGNREMYMNCASVEFTGGDGGEMVAFPPLFVANLASVGTCATVERVNVAFPDPGKYATRHAEGGSPYPYEVPTGAGCAAAAGGGGAGGDTSSPEAPPAGGTGGSGGGGAGSSPPAPKPTTQAPAPAPAPPAPESSSSSTPAAAPTAPTPSAPANTPNPPPPPPPPPAATPSAPAATAPPAGSAGDCPAGHAPCTDPGELVCMDATHFGICDVDRCAMPQAVAPGTQCAHGAITRKRSESGRPGYRQRAFRS